MPNPIIFFTAFAAHGVPDWVRLVPMGTFRPTSPNDKRGPFTLDDPAAVIAATTPNLPLLVDEDHVSLTPGAPAPARGWIVALEARADGLYGKIEWTETGRAQMAEKAYRGFSPVFEAGKGGAVLKIVSLAGTNNPALPQLNRFTSQWENTMDLTALRRALGLPDTADEAAILARATENTAHAAGLSALATAAGLTGVTAADAVVTALRGRVASGGEVTALATQVRTLEGELTTLRQGVARSKAEAFVDAQITAGKPVNALRQHYIDRHIADPAAVETELNALVSINAGGVPQNPGAGGGGAVQLTATEAEVVEHMGVDPVKFVAERDRQTALTAGRRVNGGAR